MNEFEMVEGEGTELVTERLKADGGWLYRTTLYTESQMERINAALALSQPSTPAGVAIAFAADAPEPTQGKWLDGTQAAEHLGISKSWLAKMRSAGKGPSYYDVGSGWNSKVRYQIADLDAWVMRAGQKGGKA